MRIEECDYEQYCFVLPSGNRIGRNRKRYVREQLEKQHPCYSDTCCYDLKYTLVNKKLAARVVVMEKSVLARYRLTNNGKTLFCKNHLTNRDEKVFQKNARLLLYMPALILPILIPAFLPKTERYAQENFNIVAKETPADIQSTDSLLSELFFVINQKGGRISFFEYIDEGQSEKFTMGVSGIYPETLCAENGLPLVFSPVAFADKNPSFSVSMTRSVSHEIRPADSAAVAPLVRNIIFSTRGTPVRENFGESEIECFIPQARMAEFFKAMDELFADENLFIKYAAITESVESKNTGEGAVVVIKAIKPQGIEKTRFRFNLLGEYAHLMKTRTVPQRQEEKPRIALTHDADTFSAYKKIGVIYQNKKITEFYRTPEGKIIRRDI
jgi:hypothetical protein